MIIMLYGGSACGKSELAEELCQRLGGRTLYVATMRPYGAEAQARIERHRQLRAGKGFDTMEYYNDLRHMGLPQEKSYDNLLLECAGNVVATGLFEFGLSPGRVLRGVMEGIRGLHRQVGRLLIVTNDIFADGVAYEEGTTRYLACMAEINQNMAQLSDVLIEVVCGLPLYHKGLGELTQ